MFRRFILTGLMVSGLAAGVAAVPASAEAHPPVVVYHGPRRVEFEVVFRHNHHWHVAGTYCSRIEAERVAERLRCRGYFVDVRPI